MLLVHDLNWFRHIIPSDLSASCSATSQRCTPGFRSGGLERPLTSLAFSRSQFEKIHALSHYGNIVKPGFMLLMPNSDAVIYRNWHWLEQTRFFQSLTVRFCVPTVSSCIPYCSLPQTNSNQPGHSLYRRHLRPRNYLPPDVFFVFRTILWKSSIVDVHINLKLSTRVCMLLWIALLPYDDCSSELVYGCSCESGQWV